MVFAKWILFVGLIHGSAAFGESRVFPQVRASMVDGLDAVFLFDPVSTREKCEEVKRNVTSAITSACTNCEIRESACLRNLDTSQAQLWSSEALAIPALVLPNGVVAFESLNPELALAACRETQRQVSRTLTGVGARCFSPNEPRAERVSHSLYKPASQAIHLFLFLVALCASALACYLIYRFEHLHAHVSHDHSYAGPQKFHDDPTPRIGGTALFFAILACSVALTVIGGADVNAEFGLLILAALPVFLGGLAEDVTKRVSVSTRLLLAMLAALLGAWILDATLHRLDVAGMDALMTWQPFALLLTVIAVAGVANAVNIIDGYNGLATGYALIVAIALGVVAYFVGDVFVLASASVIAGALLGFLFWNFPTGKIFLGDGGAYLTGFWVAELSVILVTRNPQVSPWFPLVLLVYPVFETLFTIYRRAFLRKSGPGQADANHMHQMLFRCLRARIYRRQSRNRSLLEQNNMVAPYIWGASAVLAAAALLTWRNTGLLVAVSLAFCAAYVALYRWLERSDDTADKSASQSNISSD